ncbi:hypothetical protein VNO80_09659 [Phaseolus coccineus]|uniref:Uncharacterized protein n=1 Tax=Phaseolus coccineus TaxID=3886 RepID=A0AAN9NC09_PHACN
MLSIKFKAKNKITLVLLLWDHIGLREVQDPSDCRASFSAFNSRPVFLTTRVWWALLPSLKQLRFYSSNHSSRPQEYVVVSTYYTCWALMLPPAEANMGPIVVGPPCLIIKAQLDQAV